MFSSMLEVFKKKSVGQHNDKGNSKQDTVEIAQKNVKILLNKINQESENYPVENISSGDSEVFSSSMCLEKSIKCNFLDNCKNASIAKNQTSVEDIKKNKLYNEIESLHCLFTWQLKSEKDIVANIKNKYNDNILDLSLSEFTFVRFIGNLIISYELFQNGESYQSDMKMLEIGNWLDKLDKSTDEFYLSINIGLKHIRMANFVHVLFSTDEISGSKWLFDEIVPFDNMDNKSKAAVHAIHAVILIEYSKSINCFKNASKYAKKACELDPETSHWFHIYTLVLIAQRQSVHTENLCITEKEIHLAIQQAVMFSDGKNTCSINSLISTVLNKFVAIDYQKALFTSKTFNSNINEKNLQLNLEEDMKIIIKKHKHGEDVIPYLMSLAYKYNGRNKSKILAQICSYTILFKNNFKAGVEQFLIFIDEPKMYKDLIIHHNSLFINGSKKFNLAELICNEIRLITKNMCDTRIEDILFYYNVFLKIKEIYNIKSKDVDPLMKISLNGNSTSRCTNSVYKDETVLINESVKNKNVLLKHEIKNGLKQKNLQSNNSKVFTNSSSSNKVKETKKISNSSNVSKTCPITSNYIFLMDMISYANSIVNIFCNNSNTEPLEHFNFQIKPETELSDILKKTLINSKQHYNLYNDGTQNYNINFNGNNTNVDHYQSYQYSESLPLHGLKLNSSFQSNTDLSVIKTSNATLNSTIIDTTLSMLPKSSTSQGTYKIHLKKKLKQYRKSFRIYTDASKIQNNVGIAVVSNKDIYCYKLSSEYTSCDAEAVAILRALDYALAENYNDYLILSDSLSTLTCIQNTNTSSDVINSILYLIQAHQLKGNLISILWIPGHNSIEGNEKADKLAKKIATSSTAITYSHNSF